MPETFVGKAVGPTRKGVLLFALSSALLSGPWLYASAEHLPFGGKRDFLLQLALPLKRLSELTGLSYFRQCVEQGPGEWLNEKP